MAETVRPLREGFVTATPPTPPTNPEPLDNTPQAPLPSQAKLTNMPPEEPLSEIDLAREEINATRDKWPITVQLLYKPIKNNMGEEVTALTFKEPTAAEINRHGNPTRMLWDGEVIIEERKMTYIMAALCGVLPPLLEQMDPRDWNSCALRLRKFFLADLRAWGVIVKT